MHTGLIFGVHPLHCASQIAVVGANGHRFTQKCLVLDPNSDLKPPTLRFFTQKVYPLRIVLKLDYTRLGALRPHGLSPHIAAKEQKPPFWYFLSRRHVSTLLIFSRPVFGMLTHALMHT